MNGRELGIRLRSGQRVYSTHIVSPSPVWPDAVKTTGIDFVFIDTEHVPIDRTTLAWMCRTYRALGLCPVVRIPAPDPYQATMAMDAGAEGILAPYVETADEVRRLSGAVKFRPLKGQRLDRALAGEPLEPELARYIVERNAGHVLLVNIESVPAIESLDAMLAVPGLDAVQIGPHDLSASLGVPEQYAHPRFIEAVDHIVTQARAAGVGAGIHFWDSMEQEIRWARLGANLIMHSADTFLFARQLKTDIERFRSELDGVQDTRFCSIRETDSQ